MYCGSPSSVTQVENCAESATTLAPQMAATISNALGFAPQRKPITKQQVPLIIIAAEVTIVRPTRSAMAPATTQPIAPQPITRNDPTSANIGSLLPTARLARIMNGIQVHIAYNSHIWPR